MDRSRPPDVGNYDGPCSRPVQELLDLLAEARAEVPWVDGADWERGYASGMRRAFSIVMLWGRDA